MTRMVTSVIELPPLLTDFRIQIAATRSQLTHRGIAMASLRRRPSARQRQALFQSSARADSISQQQHRKYDAHHGGRGNQNDQHRAVEKALSRFHRGQFLAAKHASPNHPVAPSAKQKVRQLTRKLSLSTPVHRRAFLGDTATLPPETAMLSVPIARPKAGDQGIANKEFAES